jgi:hypothetical protein
MEFVWVDIHVFDVKVLSKMIVYIEKLLIQVPRVRLCFSVVKGVMVPSHMLTFPLALSVDVHWVENKGMDIGGHLLSMGYLLDSDYGTPSYILHLHTKTCDSWRESMLEVVCSKASQCLKQLNDNPTTMGVGNIVRVFDGKNFRRVVEIATRCNLRLPEFTVNTRKIAKFPYQQPRFFAISSPFNAVMGSMLWLRGNVWTTFFRDNRHYLQSSLYSKFETGYVNDTRFEKYEHAFERIFGVVAHHHHMTIEALKEC